MTTLYCNSCEIAFKSKKSFNSHLNTIKHKKCMNKEIKKKYICMCGKWYIHRSSLFSHRKVCTGEMYIDEIPDDETNTATAPIEQQVEELKSTIEEERRRHDEEREELREQIKTLWEKFADNTKITNNNTNSNNTNIDTQNNNVTININAFGNENLDYITDKVIVKCIGRVYNSIPILIEKIHFDPKHPENHNIKITNRKLPYASVMTENNKWKTMDKNDAIDKMVVQGYDLLDTKYEDNKKHIQPYIQDRFEEFQTKYNKQDKKTLKTIKKQVELSILNAED